MPETRHRACFGMPPAAARHFHSPPSVSPLRFAGVVVAASGARVLADLTPPWLARRVDAGGGAQEEQQHTRLLIRDLDTCDTVDLWMDASPPDAEWPLQVAGLMRHAVVAVYGAEWILSPKTWNMYCKMKPQTRLVVEAVPSSSCSSTEGAADDAAAWRAAAHRALGAVRCRVPAAVDRRCV